MESKKERFEDLFPELDDEDLRKAMGHVSFFDSSQWGLSYDCDCGASGGGTFATTILTAMGHAKATAHPVTLKVSYYEEPCMIVFDTGDDLRNRNGRREPIARDYDPRKKS